MAAEREVPSSKISHLDRGRQGGVRVLVLSASVGKGHDAAGEAAVRHLTSAGHHAILRDGLRPMGERSARAIEKGFALTVSRHPRIWGVIHDLFGFWPLLGLARTVTKARAHRLHALVEEFGPDIVLSTYPLVSIALSHLRRTAGLRAPLVVLIADYWAHPICVVTDAAAHLVPSRSSTTHLKPAARNVRVTRVPTGIPSTSEASDQRAARRVLSLPEFAFITLITGGSLGVGDLEEAAACAISQGAYPVIIVGVNKEREVHLSRRFSDPNTARVVGWTTSLPTYLKAADCLIQNAGGMTCLEAIETRRPVILYRPIPGHGRANAAVMDQIGIAIVVHNQRRLREVLSGAVNGTRPLHLPVEEPEVPFLDAVLAVLDAPALHGSPAPRQRDRHMVNSEMHAGADLDRT